MLRLLRLALLVLVGITVVREAEGMPWICVSEDKHGFVMMETGQPFVPWGFNYDHDEDGRLLEDYWDQEWPKVEQDFREMKQLGANVVRVHLQLGKFMTGPKEPNRANLDRLDRLVTMAEQIGLYLDLTGLACYRKRDVPQWYDNLSEKDRWEVQARFWVAVAGRCARSPAIFCYDLMNEPVVPGGTRQPGDWLGPSFLGSDSGYFVQFITLEQKERPRPEIARQWCRTLVTAIRKHDHRHLVTVGLVPWSLDRPGLTSGFVPKEIASELDFLAVHLYPEKGKLKETMETLAGFAVGKPVVVEEMFPLSCSLAEFEEFLDQSRKTASGWIGFYWGKTLQECRQSDTIQDALMLGWLEIFQKRAGEATDQPPWDWAIDSPERQGVDAARLEAAWANLKNRNTDAFLVIRNDKIVMERYAPGYSRTKPHYTASMAKALVGGMALMVTMDEGRIRPDDPASKYVPQWQSDPERKNITVRHLATHTSGIEDAEADNLPHARLTGWKGDFWKGLRPPNDPFTLARDRAPVLDVPGTNERYSNPGMAMLGYCVTSGLRDTKDTDLRSLLKRRIMEPLGVPDNEWSVGYGATANVDGLPLVANWGGGAYSPNAVARVGRLMLHKGNWNGRQLISSSVLKAATMHSGLPGHSGLGWWVNSPWQGNKLWASAPEDAFGGAGAGQQLLLVVPSLDLIVVRSGGQLDTDLSFWDGVEKHVVAPVMGALEVRLELRGKSTTPP